MTDFFKHTIHEDTWNFYIIEDDDDIVQDKEDAAVMDHDKKEVYFRRGHITEATVRHELWHLYVGYCYLDTAGLDQESFEEITAELFAYEGRKLDKLAEVIYNKLVKLKNGEEIND